MSDIESRKIRLGIIDLKLHNLFSIYQACKNIGYRTTVIEDNLKHYNHDIIILPGVGSFKSAMKYLNKNGTINKLLDILFIKPDNTFPGPISMIVLSFNFSKHCMLSTHLTLLEI